MTSLYIHIPFCKKACHYCDFHFSTSFKKKDEMIQALLKEIELRHNEVQGNINTIYFGGGTPSVLSNDEINLFINKIYQLFTVNPNAEITLEANPDDLTTNRIKELSKTKINRLSIGIQSFYDQDLQLMNRAHNAQQAEQCLQTATEYFENITIDLIYGIPNMDNQRWLNNIHKALQHKIPHISAYALTVEPQTALNTLINKGKIPNVDDHQAYQQFMILVKTLEQNGYIHYEISNFGKEEKYFSANNTAYWTGKPYIGIGPSAHSFNGKERAWNVANNSIYIKNILNNALPQEYEILSTDNQYNEIILTGLRTIFGVSLALVKNKLGETYLKYLLKNAQKYIDNQQLELKNNHLKTTLKGKFFTDGISADLFV